MLNGLRDALKYRTLSFLRAQHQDPHELQHMYAGTRRALRRVSGTEGTSVIRNETVRDTVTMMCANHFDVIVMRHPLDGSLQGAADVASIPVMNGGDGNIALGSPELTINCNSGVYVGITTDPARVEQAVGAWRSLFPRWDCTCLPAAPRGTWESPAGTGRRGYIWPAWATWESWPCTLYTQGY